jgi:polar amino acid transport system substrate-binding protein/arginine/ornithine transport system substrate-binding protein
MHPTRRRFTTLLSTLLATLAATAAATLLPNAAWAQAPDLAKDGAMVRVGVEGNYPPFSKLGTDGKLSGFDIDIALAVCARIRAECTLVQQEWDGMMPALGAKKFDMIVASMTITDERRKAADFSDPYYDVPSRWVARAGAFKDADELSQRRCGRGVVVRFGGVQLPKPRRLALIGNRLRAHRLLGVYIFINDCSKNL